MSGEGATIELVAEDEMIEQKLPTVLIYGSSEMISSFENLGRQRLARLGDVVVGNFSQLTIESIPLEEPIQA